CTGLKTRSENQTNHRVTENTERKQHRGHAMKTQRRFSSILCVFLVSVSSVTLWFVSSAGAEELPGTQPLTREGDIAAQMVAGIDKYLMRELDAAAKGGADKWQVDTTDLKSYLESVKPNRERLAKILGVVDERIKPATMEYIGEGTPSALVAET